MSWPEILRMFLFLMYFKFNGQIYKKQDQACCLADYRVAAIIRS